MSWEYMTYQHNWITCTQVGAMLGLGLGVLVGRTGEASGKVLRLGTLAVLGQTWHCFARLHNLAQMSASV